MAALAVVLFHYSNFMVVGDILPATFVLSDLPFYRYAPLLFRKGWLAVDLFFSLSGFVFFWLYSDRIANGSIKASNFFILRFSRLYPLHLLTLLLVAIFRLTYTQSNASVVAAENTDTTHFLLQLLFASNWLPSFGFSFNRPIWSVSIEVLLYIIFFCFCRYSKVRPLVMAVIAVMGWWLIFWFNNDLGRGIGSFFVGGLTYLAYLRIVRHPARGRLLLGLALLTCLFWVVGLSGLTADWSFVSGWLSKRSRYYPVVLMFPFLVLILALFETQYGYGRSLAWLGDISYAVYLIHFPLQLAFLAIADGFGLPRSTFYSTTSFLLFFSVLIALSVLSYRYFEKPAQSALRGLVRGRSAGPTIAERTV